MDSLIRLDTALPNVSTNANNHVNNTIKPDDNFLNTQLTNGVCVIDLSKEPDVDLTIVHDNQRLQPILKENAAMNPNTTHQSSIIVLEEGFNVGSQSRSPVKHKLPESPQHSLPKVPKTANNFDVPFTLVNNFQYEHPNTSLRGSSSIKPPIQTMKTHTVTSGETYDLGLAGSSNGMNCGREQNDHINLIQQYPEQTTNGRQEPKEKNEDSMFYQLLDLFPDIDLVFLKDQCQSGLNFNEITERILNMENYPKYNVQIPDSSNLTPLDYESTNTSSVTRSNMDLHMNKAIASSNNCTQTSKKLHNETSEQNFGNSNFLQSQFNFLMEIFPDADPNFMEIKCKLKDNELRNFISECMEKPDYPKVTELMKQEKCEVQDESVEIGLYTSDFSLENFLKIFPNPFEYFLDEKRNCNCSEHGFEFLKRRYRCHSVKIISKMYKEFKYNLFKTCEYLDGQKSTRTSKRSMAEIKMPDVTNLPFLQEACFIEHKKEIKEYLDQVSVAKRLAYEQAEAKGELIECGCCYQNVMFEDCTTCNEGHLFCKICVRKSVDVRIGDGLTSFPCLQDCDSVFSFKLLETLVDATMFSRLLQRIQIDEVRAADIEGLEVCPFCEFAIILPPETNIFKCLNPECLKESCRKCHRLSHIPQRCEELENDDQARARKYIEDEMTRALVRECYKCKKSFIKTDGCNKMTCTCGAKMCYICRQPIVDYKHFNGPGGEEKQKCPLYSTEKLLHVDAVEAVAKRALEEVTSKNPELKLKHDPTKMLPSADEAKSTLPPGVNEEANRLLQVLQNLRQIVGRPNERENPPIAEAVVNGARIIRAQIDQNLGRVVHQPQNHLNPGPAAVRANRGRVVHQPQNHLNPGPAAVRANRGRVVHQLQNHLNLVPAAVRANRGRVVHQPQNHLNIEPAAAYANQERVIHQPQNHLNLEPAAAHANQERVIHQPQNHLNLEPAAVHANQERVIHQPQNHLNQEPAAAHANQERVIYQPQNNLNLEPAAAHANQERVIYQPQNHLNLGGAVIPDNLDWIDWYH